MHVSIDSLITLQIGVCVCRVVRQSSVFTYISTRLEAIRGPICSLHKCDVEPLSTYTLNRLHSSSCDELTPQSKMHIFPLSCSATCPSRDVCLIWNIMELVSKPKKKSKHQKFIWKTQLQHLLPAIMTRLLKIIHRPWERVVHLTAWDVNINDILHVSAVTLANLVNLIG